MRIFASLGMGMLLAALLASAAPVAAADNGNVTGFCAGIRLNAEQQKDPQILAECELLKRTDEDIEALGKSVQNLSSTLDRLKEALKLLQEQDNKLLMQMPGKKI